MARSAQVPDEIWDLVIDYYEAQLDLNQWLIEERFRPVLDSYRTLCSCCLVCTAWLPRSRRNLYTTLILRRYEQIDQLLFALSSHSALSCHTRTLCVYSKQEFIPFAKFELVSQLTYVNTLLTWVDWRLYPCHYPESIGRYPVSKLFLWGEVEKTDVFRRIVESFRGRIDNLSLVSWTHIFSTSHAWYPYCPIRRLNSWNPVRQLEIGERFLSSHNFPKWLALMTSVVDLTLYWDDLSFHKDDSSAVLNYVSSLHRLESLTLQITSKYYDYTFGADGRRLPSWLTSTISQTRTHQNLHSVRISCWTLPGHSWRGSSLSRHVFLDTLFTQVFEERLCDVSALQRLAFDISIYDHDDSSLETRWWKERIREKLSSFKGEVSVEFQIKSESEEDELERAMWIPWAIEQWLRTRVQHRSFHTEARDDSSASEYSPGKMARRRARKAPRRDIDQYPRSTWDLRPDLLPSRMRPRSPPLDLISSPPPTSESDASSVMPNSSY
ncbi:hypothetical protein C8Q78DRAFT_710862 [Trametes maxima]|nr:hypothetical protein C8Q78DRAFT_710862 [Trametes maxima]